MRSVTDFTGGVANSLLMTHPLFCRFKNRQVENAFAIYKANSSMSTLHLLLTVALGLLTVGSLVVAPMFNDVVDRRYIDKWTQAKISTFTFLVYGRRAYQLMHRQHRVYMGKRAVVTEPVDIWITLSSSGSG